jgi:hypothetical protein
LQDPLPPGVNPTRLEVCYRSLLLPSTTSNADTNTTLH